MADGESERFVETARQNLLQINRVEELPDSVREAKSSLLVEIANRINYKINKNNDIRTPETWGEYERRFCALFDSMKIVYREIP